MLTNLAVTNYHNYSVKIYYHVPGMLATAVEKCMHYLGLNRLQTFSHCRCLNVQRQ